MNIQTVVDLCSDFTTLVRTNTVSQADIAEIVSLFDSVASDESCMSFDSMTQTLNLWAAISSNAQLLMTIHPRVVRSVLHIAEQIKQFGQIGSSKEEVTRKNSEFKTSCNLSELLRLSPGDICEIKVKNPPQLFWKNPPNSVLTAAQLNNAEPTEKGDTLVFLGEVEVQQNFPSDEQHLFNKYLVSKWLLTKSNKIVYCRWVKLNSGMNVYQTSLCIAKIAKTKSNV